MATRLLLSAALPLLFPMAREPTGKRFLGNGGKPLQKLETVSDARLAEDVGDVVLDCVGGDEEPRGNLLIREPLDKKGENVFLTSRKPELRVAAYGLILQLALWGEELPGADCNDETVYQQEENR